MFDLKHAVGWLAASLLASPVFADVPEAPDTGPMPVVEIKMAVRKFEFSPRRVTVRKGELVRLVVTSEDSDHGIAIDEFGVDRKIPARSTGVVEFAPDREGTFRIYCSAPCGDGHADMEGELIVTPAPVSAALRVRFDDDAPGVIYVESNGERYRIDPAARTVTRLAEGEQSVGSRPAIASQSRERPRPAEPYDYRIVNVPTPKRVPRNSLNVHFTHRFQQPVRQDDVPVKEEFRGLFGLDSSSVSSFGLTYGMTDRLYVSAFRSPLCQPGLCRTIELGLGYHILDEAGRSPLSLAAYASVEGNDNFSEEFTYNLQAMVGRSVTRHVNLFFSPAVHFNSNGQGRFNPRIASLFPLSPEAASFELGQHTGSFGFGVNARIRPTTSLLFEYTPRVGFKLGQVEAHFNQDFTRIESFTNRSEAALGFGIEKRIGRHAFSLTFSNTQTTTTSRYNSSNLFLPPSRFTIGFNLFRRLL